ncbi:protein kinase family protein [Sutcliffiella cohnii]
MKTYKELAAGVIFEKKGFTMKLKEKPEELELIGKGRSAFAFKIRSTNIVLKVFFPSHLSIVNEEAMIYKILDGNPYYPKMYDYSTNFIAIDYIDGDTLFQCLTTGKYISKQHIVEIDRALKLARESGLNPSDVHLRNILITDDGHIKLIDVARFRQTGTCTQWNDLKRAYKYYRKVYCPKQLPSYLLNCIAFLYKKRMLRVLL